MCQHSNIHVYLLCLGLGVLIVGAFPLIVKTNVSFAALVICQDWPHVDEVLGQGDALAVPADGDGPVQVGGGVAVLAVGDADHRAADLSETNTTQNRFPVWHSISSFKIARLSPSHLKN